MFRSPPSTPNPRATLGRSTGGAALGRAPSGSRRGSILLVVLVLVALLSLGAYTFTEWMLAEAEATSMYQRGVQARLFAESGIEYAALLVGDPTIRAQNIEDNPQLFQGILVRDGAVPRSRGYFSLIVPGSSISGTIRYGVADESSKLNLNAMMQWGLDETQQHNMLSYIPGMTPEIIDAILDWMDADSTPRMYGAEADYNMIPPYIPANGPLTSLDDLLQVPGVTPELLYGEDANHNGLLDPNENDGPESLPYDNGDGRLDVGWAGYLTIFSREANRTPDGTPKINVNQTDLVALFDQIEPVFGTDVARFIAAYRKFGPMQAGLVIGGPAANGGSGGGQNQGGSGGGRGGGGSGGQGSGGGGGGNGGGGQGGGGNGGGGNGPGGGGGSGGGGQQSGAGGSGNISLQGSADTQRAGMDLSGSGATQITSLYDLVGAQVEVSGGVGNTTTLNSPWPNDPASLGQYLPDLFAYLTTSDQPFIAGRIRVDTAPAEILMGLPDMPVEVVDAIVARSMGMSGYSSSSLTGAVPTTAWLVSEGILTVEQMRQFDRYLTAGGDVFCVQSIGHFESGGPVVRMEAIVDAAASLPARILAMRDLSALGRGYAPEQLLPATSPVP